MTIMKPCLVCGALSAEGRCAEHGGKSKPSAHRRGYDRRWKALRAVAIALHPYCSDCQTTEDLTGDHLRWPALTAADIEVVCRSCNSKRGPTRRIPLGGSSGKTPSSRTALTSGRELPDDAPVSAPDASTDDAAPSRWVL